MTPALVQRQAALAAGALLATLGVLAFTDRGEEASPIPPVEAGIRWQRATVGVLPPEAYVHETTCGVRLDSGTLGVAHPVLPCGVDLVVASGGREVRTEVVERGPVAEGRDFDLTRALAQELGVRRTDEIRWRFAG
jgi:Lytic transglycolase